MEELGDEPGLLDAAGNLRVLVDQCHIRLVPTQHLERFITRHLNEFQAQAREPFAQRSEDLRQQTRGRRLEGGDPQSRGLHSCQPHRAVLSLGETKHHVPTGIHQHITRRRQRDAPRMP